MFALIDCNNFYVSCERVFNPKLENRPVVVLSNNDGCIISRSNEAKKLKIPMGAPFFKWESFCKKNKVVVFSSNYELYGDLSERVMSLLREYHPAIEVYSIDEAFLKFYEAMSYEDLVALRQCVKNYTGIPISIGVSATKTLAKAANQIAKNAEKNGVFFLLDSQPLADFPVEKVWGVGRKLTARLNQLNITTAKQLLESDPKMIRHHFSVTLEKTVRELKGISCLELDNFQPRKQIVSSRSFGKNVTELSELEEAISCYVAIATRRLRNQESVANAVYVFLQTNIFSENKPQYGNAAALPFPAPTDDTGYIIKIAKKCLHDIYRKNYEYHKAGIMLMDISNKKNRQFDLLMDAINQKNENRMKVIDAINDLIGKNTLFFAAQGIQCGWRLKSNKRSPRYTTRLAELPIAYCQ